MIQKGTKQQSACFTGHRPKDLPWGYNTSHPDCIKLRTKLKEILIKLIDSGINTFYNGLAEGFDMLAGEVLTELKSEDYPVYIIGCIPCGNQAQYYKDENKSLYETLKTTFDKLYFVTKDHYFNGCTHIRNKYMVDNSSILIAYSHKDTGGAASTVGYAKKHGLDIIKL